MQSYVYLVVRGGEFLGSVHIPVQDLNHVLGLDLPEGDEKAGPAVSAHRNQLVRYVADHLMVGDLETGWQLEFGRDRVLTSAHGTYAILEFRVAERFTGFPSEVVVGYDGIMHAHADRTATVIVKTERGWGSFRRAPEIARTFSSENTRHIFPVRAETFGGDVTGTAAVMGRRLVKKGRGLVRRLTSSGR
ncbi:MAG TPA: hypothetical protein VLG28_14515 [Acidimicrobiia bacterium]|nr:hypothetical protein [Acidimicrobiia bacterium]